ncbi:DUF2304 domain-containing protein [Holdemania filiformis]|uniref:DUF2304 domain-containing protein n=1 Tax=Holdemania filiformis DSM 12042 TaxID=545696 RepID=B9Y9T1_9FIRM|nr:DUF2304 domain-containing protein [Holdemania filiformis]EEF67263.1 hypothetical protein HOLDEFILI_02588 [Holdemania filiformis DSM 12042]
MGRLQLILFLFSILFFIIILYFIKRSKISLDLASVWILWGCGLITISIFPEIVEYTSKLLEIKTTINALYLIMIFILYCLVFYLFLKISILENKLKNLIQIIALQKKNEGDKKNIYHRTSENGD